MNGMVRQHTRIVHSDYDEHERLREMFSVFANRDREALPVKAVAVQMRNSAGPRSDGGTCCICGAGVPIFVELHQ